MPKIIPESLGHNQLDPKQLTNFVERIESLIDDRKAVNADITQVKEEADQLGYDKKMIMEMVKIRSMDPEERQERDNVRDMYLKALGLL